ncbi:MAG: hypothetical protein AB7S54_10425 [Bacteroidales bacterium]
MRAPRITLRPARPAAGLVHRSDRGIQYGGNRHLDELKKRGIDMRMTEENHCYENASAERVNGILKGEFYLDQRFYSTEHVRGAAKNAIDVDYSYL